MGKQLFGTDGIRGVAGNYPLDPRTVYAVGVALGRFAAAQGPGAEVLIGMDTRESGPWIAAQVAGGLASQGVRARFAGLITTPGVAYLTRTGPFVAGVMISASHNPYRDNGIKVFGHSGYKLPDAQEHEIEAEILTLIETDLQPKPAQLEEDSGQDEAYLEYLASTFPHSLAGLRMVVDCANGAATRLAPALLKRLGAQVETIHCAPDGKNINLNCGALHTEALAQTVPVLGADVGVALDGDADRAMFVSSNGRVIDGDGVLLLAGRYLLERGRLPGPGGRPAVVSTVMSNLGLERALERLGISMPRTAVGDKYVLEEMVRIGATLGGEQSGHIIFHEFATTGDGLLTTLRVLEATLASGKGLDELTADLQRYPQKLVNVRIRERRAIAEIPEAAEQIRQAETAFGDSGRVLVRYSGTELLARVMVEGADGAMVDDHAERIAAAIRRAIGV